MKQATQSNIIEYFSPAHFVMNISLESQLYVLTSSLSSFNRFREAQVL